MQPAAAPTHLLREHLASPLSAGGTALEPGCEIYRSERGWQLRGSGVNVNVNGKQYAPDQLLAVGDEISIGGAYEALLIEVH